MLDAHLISQEKYQRSIESENLLFDSLCYFNESDLSTWRKLNDECWNDSYWNNNVFDEDHYKVSINAKNVHDYKMLYDSFLWREVIRRSGFFCKIDNILELLPGRSLTIPVALKSLNYQGILYRIDISNEIELSSYFDFKSYWIRNDFLDYYNHIEKYTLILGNHILDDLIYYIYKSDGSDTDKIFHEEDYLNFNSSKKIWEEISKKNNYRYIKSKLILFFRDVVNRLRNGSGILLKQYPSTFSLISGDILSINIQLSIFYSIYKNLQNLDGVNVSFFNTDSIITAPGSKYPNSFLLIENK